MNTMSKRILSRVAVAGAALAMAAPAVGVSAGGFSYPPDYNGGVYLVADPNPVEVNENFVGTLWPCTAGEIVPITFEGETINATCTNPHAKATFKAPPTPGVYVLSARYDNRTLLRDVHVVSATTSGSMPSTGSSAPSLLLSIGLSAVLTGAVLYVVARRRHIAVA